MDISSYIPSITAADPRQGPQSMGISSYIPSNSITVADPRRGHNANLWGIDIEVVEKWLIQVSRFHTQYENDKMGLCCLQRKIHKTELLLLAQICTKSFVGLGFAPDPTAGAYSAPQTL